jgi:hypothetical protein
VLRLCYGIRIVYRLARDIFTPKIDHFDIEVEPFEGGANDANAFIGSGNDVEVEDVPSAMSIEVCLL